MDSYDLLEAYDYRELAERAGYSVSQIYRRAAAAGIEKPMSARRRVLIERAAYYLVQGNCPIGEIALDSGFDSPEGFSRAFRRHYGVAPSVYRQLAPAEYRCGRRSGLHYIPGPWEIHRQGEAMTLIKKMIESHYAATQELLQVLERHPEVHETVLPLTNPMPFPGEPDDEPMKALALRCATCAGPWLHAIEGYDDGPWDGEVSSLLKRMEGQRTALLALLDGIERDGTWETTFIDADCNPPEVFSYGSVVHHIIAFSEHTRLTLAHRLRHMGIQAPDGLPPQV